MDTATAKKQLANIGLTPGKLGSGNFDKLARDFSKRGSAAISSNQSVRKAFNYRDANIKEAIRKNPKLYYDSKN